MLILFCHHCFYINLYYLFPLYVFWGVLVILINILFNLLNICLLISVHRTQRPPLSTNWVTLLILTHIFTFIFTQRVIEHYLICNCKSWWDCHFVSNFHVVLHWTNSLVGIIFIYGKLLSLPLWHAYNFDYHPIRAPNINILSAKYAVFEIFRLAQAY